MIVIVKYSIQNLFLMHYLRACCYGADREAYIRGPGHISDPVTMGLKYIFFNPLIINFSKNRNAEKLK